jgi:hypothetical protein
MVMKKLSLFLGSVAIICFINVATLRADGTVNQTNNIDTPTLTPPPPEEEPEPETTQPKWTFGNFPSRLFTLVSNMLKTKHDTANPAIQNAR